MRCLALNASFEPLTMVPVRRALRLVIDGKAEIVEADKGEVMRSARLELPRPAVIRLMKFVHVPRRFRRQVTNTFLFARDEYRCQFCGRGDLPLTVDHVVPLSRGGEDTWENLVCCCRRCNTKKGDKTLTQSGMKLHRPPRRPRYIPYISLTKYVAGTKNEIWRSYLPAVPELNG